MTLLDGRVVVITGAGGGLGRCHALACAAQGARVVVNDIGTSREGEGASSAPADLVVEEIRAAGGQAVANKDDIAEWTGGAGLVQTALDAFGRLDTLVCNAGFLRDRMLANMSIEEWDAVIRVHLRGHFAPSRHAIAYWRDQSKAGERVDARIINTSSGAGLMGSVGQGNYAAAKAGIVGLTLNQSAEFARYGVTANAIAPSARTRMTEVPAMASMMAKPSAGFDAMDPANVSPLVVWLASAESAHVTGRVFEVEGGQVSVADGFQHGPRIDKGARWDPSELGPVIAELLMKAPESAAVYGA